MNFVFDISCFSPLKLSLFDLKKSEIKKNVLKILSALEKTLLPKFKKEIEEYRFEIIFCNDKKIRDINSQYRAKNTPTDVITFSLFYDDPKSVLEGAAANLGEIIISLETAQKQAKEGKFKEEVATLITHGILHLFGFDHLTDEDYNFIVKIQEDVLKSL